MLFLTCSWMLLFIVFQQNAVPWNTSFSAEVTKAYSFLTNPLDKKSHLAFIFVKNPT